MDLFSIWHLLVILLIVVVLFGTSKVRNIGNDLGGAIKSFRSAMKEESGTGADGKSDTEGDTHPPEGRVIEGRARPEGAARATKGATRSRKG